MDSTALPFNVSEQKYICSDFLHLIVRLMVPQSGCYLPQRLHKVQLLNTFDRILHLITPHVAYCLSLWISRHQHWMMSTFEAVIGEIPNLIKALINVDLLLWEEAFADADHFIWYVNNYFLLGLIWRRKIYQWLATSLQNYENAWWQHIIRLNFTPQQSWLNFPFSFIYFYYDWHVRWGIVQNAADNVICH